jgi:exodeoxyribonuclease VII large subunit
MRALNTVSPLATLNRGFAVVSRVSDGTLIGDAAAVAIGDEIEARLARGTLKARVTETESRAFQAPSSKAPPGDF